MVKFGVQNDRWEWEIADAYDIVSRYRTDKRGDGLWVETSEGWSQRMGDLQFSIPYAPSDDPETLEAAAIWLLRRFDYNDDRD
jgi:hypothetical protein